MNLNSFARQFVCGAGPCDVMKVGVLHVVGGELLHPHIVFPDYGGGFDKKYYIHEVYSVDGDKLECPAIIRNYLMN
jgi:hypothetical protein